MGYAQHDSQNLLRILLEGLYEDMKIVTKNQNIICQNFMKNQELTIPKTLITLKVSWNQFWDLSLSIGLFVVIKQRSTKILTQEVGMSSMTQMWHLIPQKH